MLSQGQLGDQRRNRGFSKRSGTAGLPPYSFEYSKAKQKAYQRYRQIYPLEDKENIYPLSKTPSLGFYLMKGYKHEAPSSLRDSQQGAQSSDKIITHLLKRYLERKEQAMARKLQPVSVMDLSVGAGSVRKPGSGQMRVRPGLRAVTEYEVKSPNDSN